MTFNNALNLTEELSAYVEPYLSAEILALLHSREYSNARVRTERELLDEHEWAMLN
jgi:hypothetical protein